MPGPSDVACYAYISVLLFKKLLSPEEEKSALK